MHNNSGFLRIFILIVIVGLVVAGGLFWYYKNYPDKSKQLISKIPWQEQTNNKQAQNPPASDDTKSPFGEILKNNKIIQERPTYKTMPYTVSLKSPFDLNAVKLKMELPADFVIEESDDNSVVLKNDNNYLNIMLQLTPIGYIPIYKEITQRRGGTVIYSTDPNQTLQSEMDKGYNYFVWYSNQRINSRTTCLSEGYDEFTVELMPPCTRAVFVVDDAKLKEGVEENSLINEYIYFVFECGMKDNSKELLTVCDNIAKTLKFQAVSAD